MKFSDSSPRLYLIPVLCLFFLFHGEAGAQNVALKTNLPYAAAASANLGLEVGLAPRWTLDISGNYMPWKFYNGLLRKHSCSRKLATGSATGSPAISSVYMPTAVSSM